MAEKETVASNLYSIKDLDNIDAETIDNSSRYIRSEIDLTLRTAFLSDEPINAKLSRPAPSLAQYVMKNLPNWEATTQTFGVSYNNRCVFDPKDFDGPSFNSVLEDVRTICNLPIETGYNSDARNSIVVATNAAAMAAINSIPARRVLVCGMDKHGADLKRIHMGMQLNGIRHCVVDVVDWNKDKHRALWPTHPGITIRSVVEELSLLVGDLEDSEQYPRYDLILLNHTFASFAHFDLNHLMDIMEYNRRNRFECVLVGTYWDPHEMMQATFNSIDPITRHFSYNGEEVCDGVRYHKFCMLNTYYMDPVIDPYALRIEFMKKGFYTENWHASRYVQRYNGFRPDILKKVKALGGLRVFVADTFTKGGYRLDKDPSCNSPECFKASFQNIENVALVASFPVKKNKGRHWIGRDSMYIGPDVLVAEKLDGVHFQAEVVPGVCRFVTALGAFSANLNLSKTLHGTHYLEGEVMLKPGWSEIVTFKDNFPINHIEEIVIFDGVPAGSSHLSSFLDRWLKIQEIFGGENTTSRCFRLQKYIVHPSSFELQEIWNSAKEGIVIQPACSPAGSFKDGLGSARYIKRRITYEEREKDKIVEVDLNGKRIRSRPDRVLESTAAEIALIREYWTYDEFALFYRVMSNLNDPNGYRYPVCRTVKEYCRAVAGVHHGIALDDVVEDIYKAYLSSFAGELTLGPIANVGVLIKSIDKLWRTAVSPGDFYRITGHDMGVCDALMVEIENKMDLSFPGCTDCIGLSDNIIKVMELDRGDKIWNFAVDCKNNGCRDDRTYYSVTMKAFRDAMTKEGCDVHRLIDHWFMLKGVFQKDGFHMKFKPMGELKISTCVDSTIREESYVESLELFQLTVNITYDKLSPVTNKMYLASTTVNNLFTPNVILDCNEMDEFGRRCWYRPVIHYQHLSSEKARCLGDMLRYFMKKYNCSLVSGISKD